MAHQLLLEAKNEPKAWRPMATHPALVWLCVGWSVTHGVTTVKKHVFLYFAGGFGFGFGFVL
jgi:hypothetical protein